MQMEDGAAQSSRLEACLLVGSHHLMTLPPLVSKFCVPGSLLRRPKCFLGILDAALRLFCVGWWASHR
jgi:hypothetical protein